jgi:hypothetical protein
MKTNNKWWIQKNLGLSKDYTRYKEVNKGKRARLEASSDRDNNYH